LGVLFGYLIFFADFGSQNLAVNLAISTGWGSVYCGCKTIICLLLFKTIVVIVLLTAITTK